MVCMMHDPCKLSYYYSVHGGTTMKKNEDVEKYLIENREVSHTELPGLLGEWAFKNKGYKIFDFGTTYQVRRVKKLTSKDLYVLEMNGLDSIEGGGGSSLVITLKKK